MALLRHELAVDVPAEWAWGRLADWRRQGEWIPLTRVEPQGDADRVGGRLRAWTGIGPVGFWDPMVVTAWEPPAGGRPGRCEVLHTGRVVRGEGGFTVTATGPERCRVLWWERVDLPGGPVGRLVWRVARPVLERLLGRVLARLAVGLESSHAGA